MHVEATLLANVARVDPDGLLYVEGGGWQHYPVLTLPATLDGHLAGIIALDESELGQLHLVGFAVSQGGKRLESPGSMIVSSARTVVPFAWRFTTIVHAEGVIAVELSDDSGEVFGAAECKVVLAAPS